jgi:hypothetical protein
LVVRHSSGTTAPANLRQAMRRVQAFRLVPLSFRRVMDRQFTVEWTSRIWFRHFRARAERGVNVETERGRTNERKMFFNLTEAYLCSDCEAVGNSAIRCPRCQSTALMLVVRAIPSQRNRVLCVVGGQSALARMPEEAAAGYSLASESIVLPNQYEGDVSCGRRCK